MKRIILLDDHDLYRLGLRIALQSQSDMQVVAETGDAQEFFARMKTLQPPPDLAVLDVILPSSSGVEVARRLRNEYPTVKILMLTSDDRPETLTELSRIGMDGFVSKASPMSEVVSAVVSVLDDMPYFGKDISRLLTELKRAHKGQVEFTAREQEIISLCGRGFIGKEIAEKLHISPRTVETHKANIFSKLGINSTQELIIYAIKQSLVKM